VALRVLTVLALAYSIIHFIHSGIRLPLDHPNLAKFEEQAAGLRAHLRSGEPVHNRNPEQYGPVFFFVMHPLLRADPDDETLARRLYAIQLAALVVAFAFTAATLRAFVPADPDRWPLLVAWLIVLWLNFSPLYTILAQKSVETWELALLSIALYAHLRRWIWVAAVAIAAAGLVKVLPLVFLYYFLMTDRRAFGAAVLALALLLAAGQALYGPEMGWRYLPRVAAGAAGNSYGLVWHENISLKAAVAKLLGRLPPPTFDAARTSGYFVELRGWRETATIAVGDASVLAAGLGLTWSWLRGARRRSSERILWEWSVLGVAILILAPNTTFEYLTLAIGSASYALVTVASGRRLPASTSAALAGALLLGGAVLPRQWLNRLLLIETWKPATPMAHLTASEAYQYVCGPLVGLVLLAWVLWRVRPDAPARRPGAVRRGG
jgi:glycosyl transferase family 87